MLLCPYCGHRLPRPLSDGMSSCVNCFRVFDSSRRNLLLSTAWLVRKRNINDANYLMNYIKIPEDDAKFIIDCVYDKCFNPEEILKIIEKDIQDSNQRKAS